MHRLSLIIYLLTLTTQLFAGYFSENDSLQVAISKSDSTQIIISDSTLQTSTSHRLSPDTIALHIAHARRLMKEYKIDVAIVTLEKAYARDSSSIELVKELEEIYYSTSENTKALEFVNLLLDQGIDSAVYLPRKALVMKKEGNLPEALHIFRDLIRKDSANTFFLNQLGDIFNMVRKPDSALIYYTKSVEVSPKNITLFKAGQLFLDLEKPGEALSFFDQYYNPEIHDSKPLRRLYGQTFFLLNEYEESIKVFDELYQKGDSSFITTKFLGMSYRKNGEYLEAEIPLKQAAFQNPNDFLVYYNLGICCRNIGQTDESERYFHTALDIITTPPAIRNMIIKELAENYKRATQWHKALKIYNEILESDPTNMSVRMDILMILDYQLKDAEKAINGYKNTLAMIEEDTTNTQNKGRMIKYLNQRIEKLEEQKFWEESGKN
ncbi:tetratricopeptide repeat protein [Marinilabilia salmonicolor]|jgi:tetratricopeptide (TPR) repeat protein|uniref:Flp pilus assembly protein TadD n=1 Tax=Marinilabilia salmonicolor TaxID=989 RepID=A0A368VBT1_9BACT|nr:tetratricopeptide repeat protein [Marinilabilia salmonicolor]RCW38576.1 Flp pilus assembly protein TadD [Marinilabilia salmonicolor]